MRTKVILSMREHAPRSLERDVDEKLWHEQQPAYQHKTQQASRLRAARLVTFLSGVLPAALAAGVVVS